MRFLSNFGCKIIFICFDYFWHQQDSKSLFKESIGHVTSPCKWPNYMPFDKFAVLFGIKEKKEKNINYEIYLIEFM